jgi:glutamate/tyrosine decarboxylase-like PLP-dependent enzyme
MEAIHWIGGTKGMDLDELQVQYRRDSDDGYQPFLVVGSAGTVSTGAVDPLPNLARSVTSTNSGSTSTAPTGHSHPG